MKVIESPRFKKDLKSKKLQKKHKEKIQRIIGVLVSVECFKDLESNSFASMYKFERLKHSLNAFFSFRVDNKVMRIIVKPNTVVDYQLLNEEKEVCIECISFDHYKDI